MSAQSNSVAGGAFVISLDFELHWGVRDSKTLSDYRANLIGSREVIPRMLELFASFGVHATWATVGFLFCESRDELLASLPEQRPQYSNARLSPYDSLHELGHGERDDPIHFAPSIVWQIRQCPGQEVASHTFSHYYCLEPGQDVEAFRADLEAAKNVAARRGIRLKSIVFPRNQMNAEYLRSCREAGFIAYRGNEQSELYKPRRSQEQRFGVRALRLADAYVKLSPEASFVIDSPDCNVPVNIPSSRFLRPCSQGLRALEPLRFRRIATEMTEAARRRRVYHLWWHPHNFGIHQEQNLSFCTKILQHFRRLQEDYGMESASMEELASRQPGVVCDTEKDEHAHRFAGRTQ